MISWRFPVPILVGMLFLVTGESAFSQDYQDLEGAPIVGYPESYDLGSGLVTFVGSNGARVEIPLERLHPKSRLNLVLDPGIREGLRTQGWKVPEEMVTRLVLIFFGIVLGMIFYQFLIYWTAARVVTEQKGFRLHLGAFVKLVIASIVLSVIYQLVVHYDRWGDVVSGDPGADLAHLTEPAHPAIGIISVILGFLVRMFLIVGHYDTVGFAKSLWLLLVDAVLQVIGWGLLAVILVIVGFVFVPLFQEGADVQVQAEWLNDWVLRPFGLIRD